MIEPFLCPHCREEIEELYQVVECSVNVDLDRLGKTTADDHEMGHTEPGEWQCPECGKIIEKELFLL